MHDIGMKFNVGSFRLRAVGIVIKEGKVLMVHHEKRKYYSAMGGAVRMGEKASDAAIREVYEESGLKVEIDRLLFVHENFFEMEDGLHHEVVFYYLMKDIGEQKIVCDRVLDNIDAGLVWLSIYNLNKSTVYPKIYNTILTNMPNEVTYFVTDERTQ